MSVTEAARAQRRAEIERALALYPQLDPAALAELTRYFEHEASALDVGLIASNEALAEPYRAFRTAHVDPLRPRDWMRGAVFALVMGGAVLAIVWPAL